MNPSLPFPLENGAFIIDTSTLERYTTCPRSFEYYAMHKRELAATRWPLQFGKAFHVAMEARYGTDAPVDAQLSLVRSFFEENPPPPDDHRDLAYMVELLSSYDLFYIDEPFELLCDDNGKRMVEVPFCLPLKNDDGSPFHVLLGSVQDDPLNLIPVFYSGRIDMLTVWDGLVYPLDHKTTSIMGDKYFDEYQNGQQPLGYSWAAREMVGKPPGGYVINAVATRKLTKAGKGIELRRQKFFLENERIDEWLVNTREIIQNIADDYNRGTFPMHTKWCVGKYGRCPYFDVCTLPPAGREQVLHSTLFTDKTWSPLNEPEGTA